MTKRDMDHILRISEENTIKLIDLYSKEDCLWNTYKEEYTQKTKRAEAAQRIAKALNIPRFEAKHVMIKFKNLRNSYCQELKKIAHSVSNPSETRRLHIPRVFWFSKMDSFLRPHLQKARENATTAAILTGGKISEPITEEEENFLKKGPRIEDVEEWIQMTTPESVEPERISSADSCSEAEEIPPELRPSKRKQAPSKPRPSKKKPPQKAETEFEDKLLYHTIKDLSSQLHLLVSRHNDQFESFGSYVASMLRSLPQQKAMMLQPKIVDLIASTANRANEDCVSQSHTSTK